MGGGRGRVQTSRRQNYRLPLTCVAKAISARRFYSSFPPHVRGDAGSAHQASAFDTTLHSATISHTNLKTRYDHVSSAPGLVHACTVVRFSATRTQSHPGTPLTKNTKPPDKHFTRAQTRRRQPGDPRAAVLRQMRSQVRH